jgi:DNA repair protein RadC
MIRKNYPGSNLQPGETEINLTRRIKDSLKMMEV